MDEHQNNTQNMNQDRTNKPENTPAAPAAPKDVFALDMDVHEKEETQVAGAEHTASVEQNDPSEQGAVAEQTMQVPIHSMSRMANLSEEKTTTVPVVREKTAEDAHRQRSGKSALPKDIAARQKNMETAKKTLSVTGKVVLRGFSYVLNVLLTVLLFGMITGSIVVLVFALYVKSSIDPTLDVDLLTSTQSQTTTLYYYDDSGAPVELEDQRLYGSENRLWVGYDDIPDSLVDAFVSIEDHRFWTHKGVDWITTGKAVLHFATGSSSAGGSTITQQLIKNLTGEDEVRIQRKVQEIFRALNLEKEYSKEQIMEMYLNTVYLSQGTYGVQAASYKYFNKSVSELTLDECAALASIVKYPTKYDPVQNPQNNKDRRQVVLTAMRDQGYINETEYTDAYDLDLAINLQSADSSSNSSTNSWYTDAVIEDVLKDLQSTYNVSRVVASRMIYSEGLSIYTCMDRNMQSILEGLYLDDNNFPTVNSVEQLQSSCVVMDQTNGSVKALVGGRGTKATSRAYNLATQAYRSPGSSIKPVVVYGPALDAGVINYGSVFDDSPLSFNNGVAYPSNLPDVYNGLTYVDDAIARSVNTVAMRALLKFGAQEAYDFAKNKAGLEGLTDHYQKADGSVLTDVGPSLALGGLTVGVTCEQMCGAYTMFANDGIYSAPRTYSLVLDKNGKTLLDNQPKSEVAISAQSASIMTKMLQDVVTKGTGRAIDLQYDVNCAVKTGTTSSDFDRWCVGYTPYYTCAVWVGYEQPKAVNTAGVSPSTAMWNTVMKAMHQNIIAAGDVKSFQTASGVVTATFCADSGKLLTDACKADLRGSRAVTGYFTASTVPTDSCDTHVLVNYDANTGAVACQWCTNVQKVGMLNVTARSFSQQVTITDAQYVYWPGWSVSKGVTDSTSQPCFAAMIPAGTFVGTSSTSYRAANSFCYEHYQGHENDTATTTEGPKE